MAIIHREKVAALTSRFKLGQGKVEVALGAHCVLWPMPCYKMPATLQRQLRSSVFNFRATRHLGDASASSQFPPTKSRCYDRALCEAPLSGVHEIPEPQAIRQLAGAGSVKLKDVGTLLPCRPGGAVPVGVLHYGESSGANLHLGPGASQLEAAGPQGQ